MLFIGKKFPFVLKEMIKRRLRKEIWYSFSINFEKSVKHSLISLGLTDNLK